MSIKVNVRGSFSNTERFLRGISEGELYRDLDRYGKMGVSALARYTPYDTGRTSRSWYYEIIWTKDLKGVSFHNSNTNQGENVAILLQYGHGTGTGGWVSGRDYVNPAIQPVFDNMLNELWKKVTNG